VCLHLFEHLAVENTHRYPVSVTRLVRHVSELVDRDACPRPHDRCGTCGPKHAGAWALHKKKCEDCSKHASHCFKDEHRRRWCARVYLLWSIAYSLLLLCGRLYSGISSAKLEFSTAAAL
jgi:hypothetical protein